MARGGAGIGSASGKARQAGVKGYQRAKQAWNNRFGGNKVEKA